MRKLFLALTCLTLAVGLLAGSALANTAANTAIVNNAQLTFDGGSASATVTVSVSLVPSLPNVIITDTNGAYTAPDTPALTDSVIITSTANGPADYTVTPAIDNSTNTTGPSVEIAGGAANTTVSIGASVTTGTSATTYLTVPASGASGDDSAVNGIGVNDVIVFTFNSNTYTRTVTGTTDNGDGTFRIEWAAAIPGADIPDPGTQVGERLTVNLSVLPGTVQAAGTNIDVTVEAVVSTAVVGDVSETNTSPNYWTSPSPSVVMAKYVRNASDATANPSAGTGSTFTINTVGNEYFTSGVSGEPGDVLEYVIQAQNVGTSLLTGAALSDLIPEAFVTLQTGFYGGSDIYYEGPDGTFTFIAGAVGANRASFVSGSNPNLVVNVGNGADSTTTGSIPAGETVLISYRVTIE